MWRKNYLLYWLFSVLQVVIAFNVDTDHALVFQGSRGSFFGFSTILHKNSQGAWVLNGAPQSNSSYIPSYVKQPGALYKCKIGARYSCEEINVDDEGNTYVDQPPYFTNRKDNMWLGVALDNEEREGGRIVVCAHQWKDQRYAGHYLPNGKCYSLNGSLDTNTTRPRELLPLVIHGLQITIGGVYYYALGQAGISAHFSKDDILLLGAAGVRDWRGGLVQYHPRYPDNIANIWEAPNAVPKLSYLGYSVSSGKFYPGGQTNYIAGAPRAGHRGKVFILSSDFNIRIEKNGVQFGSYFGATVCGVDVTNNGLSDLLVGAPLFSTLRHGDEGRVYVYINKDLGILEMLQAPLVGSSAPWGRFGSAIAAVGDLNMDDYLDVAIAAPYEDEGRGVVYIYHGSPSGLTDPAKQRITGRSLDLGLRGFGWSISRGLDVDGNGYKDISVGAYASDQSVLLFTRPVVSLKLTLQLFPREFTRETKNCLSGSRLCVTVELCFRYGGQHIPSVLEFLYSIFIDTDVKDASLVRASFKKDHQSSQYINSTALIVDRRKCVSTKMLIKENPLDVLTPIRVSVRASLAPETTNCRLCPILNTHDETFPTFATGMVNFVRDCGDDNVCHSDLRIRGTVTHNQRNIFIEGSKEPIIAKLTVDAKLEAAYAAKVILHHHNLLNFIRVTSTSPNSITCSPQTLEAANETSLLCNIGNPMSPNSSVTLSLHFDGSQVQRVVESFLFSAEAVTDSVESSLSDNIVEMAIPVRIKTDVILSGVSVPEQIITSDSAGKPTQFEHAIDIRNVGPSQLPLSSVIIGLPFKWKGETILANISAQVKNDNNAQLGTGICIPHYPLNVSNARSNTSIGPSSVIPNDTLPTYGETNRKRRDIGGTSDSVMCSGSNCEYYNCSIADLLAGESVLVVLKADIIMTKLEKLKFSNIEVVSYTTVNISHPRLDGGHPLIRSIQVATNIFAKASSVPDELPTWVIAVSVCAGLILLIVIALILWRCGFFKREKLEEMERLMKEFDDTETQELQETGAHVNGNNSNSGHGNGYQPISNDGYEQPISDNYEVPLSGNAY